MVGSYSCVHYQTTPWQGGRSSERRRVTHFCKQNNFQKRLRKAQRMSSRRAACSRHVACFFRKEFVPRLEPGPRRKRGPGFKTRGGDGSRWSPLRLAGSGLRFRGRFCRKIPSHQGGFYLCIFKKRGGPKTGPRNDRNLAGQASKSATFSPGYLESESGMSGGCNPTSGDFLPKFLSVSR